MMSCTTAQQAVGVYTKHPSALTMPLFIALRKTECCTLLCFWRSGRRAVARGPFHNFSLVHGAVGWCAVSAWWLLLSKKMSQFITLSKHFHGQAYLKKSELRIGGLGKFWRWGSFFGIIENEKSQSPLFHNHNSSFYSRLIFLLTPGLKIHFFTQCPATVPKSAFSCPRHNNHCPKLKVFFHSA